MAGAVFLGLCNPRVVRGLPPTRVGQEAEVGGAEMQGLFSVLLAPLVP